MSDVSAPSPAAVPQAQPQPRPLWVEFLIFFFLGFGVMFLYWLLQPQAKPAVAAAPLAAQGQPLINLGAKPASVTEKTTAPDVSQTPGQKTQITPEAKTLAPAVPQPAGDDAYAYTTWETLGGFFYQPPDPESLDIPGLPKPKNEIPAEVKALSGKKVVVQGYMVPLRVRKGEVTEFVICRTIPACCFGDSTRMNEWVHVKMPKDKSCSYSQNQQVSVFGALEVGELVNEGIVLSIYRMTADQVNGPPEL